MTDLDPEIWDNKTLGAAAQNENLDRLTRQEQEDRSARIEDREPRTIVNDNTYPGWQPEVNERTGTVSSNYQTVHFDDERPNDIPVNAGNPEGDASTVQTVETPEEENTNDPTPESPAVDPETPSEGESTGTPPAEEGSTTKWA